MYQAVYYDKEERQYYLRDDRWDGFKTVKYYPTYHLLNNIGFLLYRDIKLDKIGRASCRERV